MQALPIHASSTDVNSARASWTGGTHSAEPHAGRQEDDEHLRVEYFFRCGNGWKLENGSDKWKICECHAEKSGVCKCAAAL